MTFRYVYVVTIFCFYVMQFIHYATGHNIKWDQFDILAFGKTDYHCKVKETLFIQELQQAVNVNVSCEKLFIY